MQNRTERQVAGTPQPAGMRAFPRVLLGEEPFGINAMAPFRWGAWDWPACWIRPRGVGRGEPAVFAAALDFTLDEAETLRIHVAADQRCEVLLDSLCLGRNAAASDLAHWGYATWDLCLEPGPHRIAARVWCAGELAGMAQPTWQAGFLLAAEGAFAERFATGQAPWRVRRMPGWRFVRPPQLILAAARVDADCAGIPPAWDADGPDWEEPEKGIPGQGCFHTDTKPGHVLSRAILPAQREQPLSLGRVRHADWAGNGPFVATLRDRTLEETAQTWFAGGTLVVEPRQCLRILADLGAVRCAYAALAVRGGAGATVRLEAADALLLAEPSGDPRRWWESGKGNRDDVAEKWWGGGGDGWLLDGQARLLETPWWMAGRYLLLTVATGDQPLTFGKAHLTETGYPLDPAGFAICSHPAWPAIERLCWRSMRNNAHEHWMDCPTVERLQYIGDTRVVGLTALVCTRDTALHRKAILDFDRSRDASGLPSSRAPTRWRQTIPSFSAPFVGLVHDHWMWRGDERFVRKRLPAVRSVLDRVWSGRRADGLLEGHPGWNFADWCGTWDRNSGIPPGGNRGVMGAYNWFAVLALGWAAELEEGLGEPEQAAMRRRQRRELAAAIESATWDEGRGRLRDTPGLDAASEHVLSLALLAGTLPEARAAQVEAALLADDDLARCTIYFEHYLFAALAERDRCEALVARWSRWAAMPALGLTACPEMPEPSRSDCHGWGAHPLYHLRCSLAGIRPEQPGLAAVRIRPRTGGLKRLAVSVPHPNGGEIRVRCEGEEHGFAALPQGICGTLELQGRDARTFRGEISW